MKFRASNLMIGTLTLAFFIEYGERARYARGKRSYLAAEEIQPPTHANHRA